MNAKYTALCPTCSARLPLDDLHMEMAEGNVRCGGCNAAFYAPDNLVVGYYKPVKQPTASPEELLFELAGDSNEQYVASQQHKQEHDPHLSELLATEDEPEQPYTVPEQEQAEQRLSDEDIADFVDDTQKPMRAEEAVSPMHSRIITTSRAEEATQKPTRQIWWIAGSAVALVILSFQIFIINVDSWGNHPALRGLYSQICSVGLCTLPTDVRPVSMEINIAGYRRLEDGSYQVKGLITNWAYYSQPLPVIELVLVDVAEKPYISKTYNPTEYAGDKADSKLTIAPEDKVTFDIHFTNIKKQAKRYFPRLRLVSYHVQ